MQFVLDSDLLKKDLDQESVSRAQAAVLLVEPFYGGSHKQLVDLLAREIPGCLLCCLPAKKWHWRMRTSALYFSQKIPRGGNFKTDLAPLKKLLYFHENQLIYPVRKQQDRDFHLVADVVIFNSNFNMESFLSSINSFLKLMPDYRPKGLSEVIRPKCKPNLRSIAYEGFLYTREHDKGPDLFFHVLYQLADQSLHFKVSVIGQTFTEVPAYTRISDHILHWGYQQTRQEYIAVLKTADVAVLEAVQYECYPLCPNKLVYPEIFPSEYLYSTPQRLLKKLRYFCRNPQHVRARRLT
ncbi:Glycosyltransferase-like domain-containing protein 1, partial [Acropora cervicornis]